ncbi:MAG: outer membrane beta-barrel protein [Azospirillaceae bacterium]|nr:outer membrane beta-barrel protein [Azospirillaceae bacterium]
MLAATGLTVAGSMAIPANAQTETSAGDTVATRQHPDYDPVGVRVGGFILYPSLTLDEVYDSNIYATQGGDTGDLITVLQPKLELKSNWNVHQLNFHASGDLNWYADHSRENYSNYDLGADGRLEIYHDAWIAGGADYSLWHLPRTSPNNIVGQADPTEYNQTSANVVGHKDFGNLFVELGDSYNRYDFQNAATFDGRTILWERQNHDENEVSVRAGYRIEDLYELYVRGAYNTRNYDSASDMSGYDRNSNGYTMVVGAKYNLTGVTALDVFAGYRSQDYDDPRLGNFSAPTGGAKITWNATALTTVTGEYTRDIQETIVVGSAGYFASKETLAADHELLRNVQLHLQLSHESDDFQNIGRSDDVYGVGLGAKYMMSQMTAINVRYNYQIRSSNREGTGYADHNILVGLTLHL